MGTENEVAIGLEIERCIANAFPRRLASMIELADKEFLRVSGNYHDAEIVRNEMRRLLADQLALRLARVSEWLTEENRRLLARLLAAEIIQLLYTNGTRFIPDAIRVREAMIRIRSAYRQAFPDRGSDGVRIVIDRITDVILTPI